MARPFATFLFLQRDSILRADLASRAANELVTWQESRPPVDDVSIVIESALRLGGTPAKQVWILDTELWTQILPLPLSAIRQSKPNEIAQALKFEAEALSGISAFDAEIAYQELNTLNGEKNFWCSVISSSQFKQCADLLETENCRLMGYLHPAACPAPLQANVKDPQRWRRLEVWPDLICGLVAGSGGTLEKKLINADPESDYWHSEWQEWSASVGEVDSKESLALGAMANNPDGECAHFDLSNNEILQQFLLAWAKACLAPSPAFARILPPRKPIAKPVLIGASALIALITLALCFVHHNLQLDQLSALKKETEKAQLPAKNLAEIGTKVSRLKNEQKKLSEDVERLSKKVKAGESILSVQRSRFAHLLAEVARNLPEGAILEGLETKNGDVTLRGLCSNPEKSHKLATLLAKSLEQDSWRVGGPKTEAQQNFGNEVLWTFELTLKDVVYVEEKTPVKKGKRRSSRPQRTQRPRRGGRP